VPQWPFPKINKALFSCLKEGHKNI